MFIMVMLCVSLFFLMLNFHGKLIKYLHENSSIGIKGICASAIDRGIICFLFGLAHRLLLRYPNIQLLTLIVIELVWIYSRLKLNSHKAYEIRILVTIWNIQGFLRVFLIMSFYIYEEYHVLRNQINEMHAEILSWIIYLILVEFLICTLETFK